MPKVEGVCPGKFNPIHRWFFDSTSGSCKHFLYSGCKGNANNFPSRRACQEQCSHGVCCYRQYKLPRPSISSEDEYAHSRDTLGYNATETGPGNRLRGEEIKHLATTQQAYRSPLLYHRKHLRNLQFQ
uniref:BPTI/Kunitz inhibitor domain-containing protein n=1 Tax=Astyanax mexicanus TaxID=7994 RepID=A0A3B1IUL1_ASTMX